MLSRRKPIQGTGIPLTRRAGTALLLCLAGSAAVSACSRERRHAVLTFFFDGVPPLDGRKELPPKVSSQYMRETPGAPVPAPPSMIQHPPYAKGECTRCHPKELSFSLGEEFDVRGMCFSCHEHAPHKQRFEGYVLLHGPVAVKNCLACHDPHESLNPGIVAAPDPQLCFRCHERVLVLSTSAHAGLSDPKCLSCHNPHGGDARYFLRGEAKR